MVKYSCERCGKDFLKNLTMILIIDAKRLVKIMLIKLRHLVDKAVEEKLKELNNKKLIVENEEVNVNTDTMELQEPPK